MTLLHTVRHPDRILHKGLTLRIFHTDTHTDELTTLHECALILAVEPLPPNLCAVAYVPRPKKTTQTPPDADNSTHSTTTPDTDSDPLQKYPFITPSQDPEKPEPIDPHINPISPNQINRLSSPSEQSLQAIHRADTTDFDHGFTKPKPNHRASQQYEDGSDDDDLIPQTPPLSVSPLDFYPDDSSVD